MPLCRTTNVSSLLCVALVAIGSSAAHGGCSSEWRNSSTASGCEMLTVQSRVHQPSGRFDNRGSQVKDRIRAGFLPENPQKPFGGNILYFEGFGDSMVNHSRLFQKLARAGYRVIAFDYFGQGGSEGSMDNTRISDIPNIGKQVYMKYARFGAGTSKPIIIGWSAGGLAAYYAASLNMPSKVVLIAPSLAPRLNLDLDSSAMTGERRAGDLDPNRDGFRPKSLKDAPDFVEDLFKSSRSSADWVVDPAIKGFALLPDARDAYIVPSKVEKILTTKAKGFISGQYAGARHEMDNDYEGMRNLVQRDILRFLTGVDPVE